MRSISFLFPLLLSTVFLCVSVQADPAAESLLQAAFQAPAGTTVTADAEMTQYLAPEKKKVWKLNYKRKVSEAADKVLFLVLPSSPEGGSAFSSVTTGRGSGRIARRIFFDASKNRVREIEPEDETKKFLDSDFLYWGLDQCRVGFTEVRLVGTPLIEAETCNFFETTRPGDVKKKSGSMQYWIGREKSEIVRMLFLDRKDRPRDLFQAGGYEKIGNRLFAKKWRMRKSGDEQRTEIVFSNIVFGQEIDDNVFEIKTNEKK